MRGVGQHQKDLIQATQDKILRALYAGGTTTFENLKKATVLSRRTLTKGLKRLEDCGLVETCKATEAETAPLETLHKEFLEIAPHLKLDDFLTETTKALRDESRTHTREEALSIQGKNVVVKEEYKKQKSAARPWRRTEALLTNPPNILEPRPSNPKDMPAYWARRREAISAYLMWSKNVQKRIRLPKEVRLFIKRITRQRTIYVFVDRHLIAHLKDES